MLVPVQLLHGTSLGEGLSVEEGEWADKMKALSKHSLDRRGPSTLGRSVLSRIWRPQRKASDIGKTRVVVKALSQRIHLHRPCP
jgi:hypothetical protein